MRLAVWLLDRFGVAESVTGDILERSNDGKPRWWIWRQSIAAILTISLRQARQHPWVVLRGVALGLLMVQAVDAAMRLVAFPLNQLLGEAAYDYLRVGRPTMLLLVLIGDSLVVAPCWFGIGWLVVRWHSRAVVLLLSILVIATILPYDIRQFADEFLYARPIVYRLVHVIGMAITFTNIIAGLLLGAVTARVNPRLS